MIKGNRVKVTASPVNTVTDFTLGAQVASFSSFQDGVVKYTALSNNNLWEIGFGTVTGTTLTRDTIEENHLGTTANIDFSTSSALQIAQVTSADTINTLDVQIGLEKLPQQV